MIQRETTLREFVDLEAEQEAIHRAARARSFVIGMLFKYNGTCRFFDAQEVINSDLTLPEIWSAAKALTAEGVIQESEPGLHTIEVKDRNGHPHLSLAVFRELFGVGVPVAVLGCDFYDQHINEALLDDICDIQLGLGRMDIERVVFSQPFGQAESC